MTQLVWFDEDLLNNCLPKRVPNREIGSLLKNKLYKTMFPCSLPFSVVTLIIKRVTIPKQNQLKPTRFIFIVEICYRMCSCNLCFSHLTYKKEHDVNYILMLMKQQ